MTNREFLNAIVEANVNDELTAFALAEIEKLDHTNEVRRAKMAEKAVEKAAEKVENAANDAKKTVEAVKGAANAVKDAAETVKK